MLGSFKKDMPKEKAAEKEKISEQDKEVERLNKQLQKARDDEELAKKINQEQEEAQQLSSQYQQNPDNLTPKQKDTIRKYMPHILRKEDK